MFGTLAGPYSPIMNRAFGPVADAGGLGSGDHVCWVYEGDDDHRAGITRYFADGVERGERIAYLADHYDEAAIVALLTAGGFAPRRMIKQGSLVILPARSSYPTDERGEYDLEASVAQFRALADQAVADGYTGLRVAGESDFLLETVAHQPLLAYELACDLMVRGAPLTAMCLYDARHQPADRLGQVAAVHAAAIVASSIVSDLPPFRVWAVADDTVALSGEIDFATSDAVRGALLGAVGKADVIDVSGLEFADVSAIRAILTVAAEMAGPHDRPVLKGASRQVRYVVRTFDGDSLVFDG